MRSRTSLLSELVEQPIAEDTTVEALRTYGWDCDERLVIVTKAHIRNVLSSFYAGTIDSAQVRDWANRIEGRDDIGYEAGGEGVVNEAIFWLANPYINYPIDEHIGQRIEALFESQ
jgi:hypothetical protein